MKRYFDIRDVIAESPNTHIFNIIGQGGVGKSYSTKKLAILNYLQKKEKFVYVRRWTTELKGLESVFLDTEDDAEILEAWNDSEYANKYARFHVLPRGEWFYLVGEKEDTKIDWLQRFGRIIPLSQSTRFKGGTYPKFTLIFQDEAITNEGYVDGADEAAHFTQIVDTVSRANSNCIVVICGNPDANIEASPYFQHMRIDYAHIQPNTVYYFDTVKKNGKILANNECFVKLANYEQNNTGESYLNPYTSDIWKTPQGEMRLTGEVLTKKYAQIETVGTSHIRPVYKMILETPVFAIEEYRRKLHIYFGYWEPGEDRVTESVLIVLKNDDTTLRAQIDDDRIIYARYDALDVRARPYKQVYRFTIPHEPKYAEIREIMNGVNDTRFIFTDDNRAATMYEEIARDT